jgi:hypothetical protein
MVTAGVYMVARLYFLFGLSPVASSIVAWVGGLTAVYAATIALVQNDIKRVLAYSTISQLGYMFMACGVERIRHMRADESRASGDEYPHCCILSQDFPTPVAPPPVTGTGQGPDQVGEICGIQPMVDAQRFLG